MNLEDHIEALRKEVEAMKEIIKNLSVVHNHYHNYPTINPHQQYYPNQYTGGTGVPTIQPNWTCQTSAVDLQKQWLNNPGGWSQTGTSLNNP